MRLSAAKPSGSPAPLIGVPGYWHESEALLGRMATAVPDSYIRALLKIDAVPLIIPVMEALPAVQQLIRMVDGLLLIGGPDIDPANYHQTAVAGLRKVTPARDTVELQVAQWSLAAGLPILAICRGIQVLNVVAGGTLWQDIPSQLPDAGKHDYHPGYPEDHLAHTVKPLSDSRLAGIVGQDEIRVNSLHHQAIDRLGQGLRATAFAPDGIIEAVEGIGRAWTVGVQWHPEWLYERDRRMTALFRSFREACSHRMRKRSERRRA